MRSGVFASNPRSHLPHNLITTFVLIALSGLISLGSTLFYLLFLDPVHEKMIFFWLLKKGANFSQNLVQNDPAKKKVIKVQSVVFVILLWKSVQGVFVDLKTHEGGGMKAQGWLE